MVTSIYSNPNPTVVTYKPLQPAASCLPASTATQCQQSSPTSHYIPRYHGYKHLPQLKAHSCHLQVTTTRGTLATSIYSNPKPTVVTCKSIQPAAPWLQTSTSTKSSQSFPTSHYNPRHFGRKLPQLHRNPQSSTTTHGTLTTAIYSL